MPESTLSRLLRPETIHPDICRIKVETKSQTVDTLHNVITEGSVKPPPEDKAYLIKGKALETVFAKRSTPENQLSFNLLKKSDETRIYYMVEIRSKKFLENCTAKVMPITGREKQNEMVEYDTSWDGRLNMSTIDLNPDEPAYAHLVTIPRGDSRMDHDKLLWEKCQQTSDQIKKSSLENQINFYASLPEHTRWPTCHLVGHANTMENFSVPS